MLFNSLTFFVFFAIVYALYGMLSRNLRFQNLMLVVASYIFYGWWDVRFLFLVVLSTGLDFCCGLMLGTGRVPPAQRARVSLYVVLAALAFVAMRWDAVHVDLDAIGAGPSRAIFRVDPARLYAFDWIGRATLVGTIAAVLAANLIYFPIAALSPVRRRGVVMVITIFANLFILGFFKYFNFFIHSAEVGLVALGIPATLLHLDIILPVGVSFYTFQSMSYTIDVYRGQVEPARRFSDFAVFVSFFPQLVAGPIERAADMMPRLLRPRTLTFEQSARGAYLILFGLFKKVAVADGLAGCVNSIYGSHLTPTWADVLLATLAFTVQVYGDFSGYTDIARGVAKLLGVDLMVNFNLPYLSASPSEFWQRWHISLSSWLRDYLYIPLGGNRLSSVRTYFNLTLTMLLGGLWHGAAWNYVLWGLYHGIILCLYRAAGRYRRGGGARERSRAHRLVAQLVFFALTVYGWLLFRSGSLDQVITYTKILLAGPFDLVSHIKRPTFAAIVGLPILVAYEFAEYHAGNSKFYERLPAIARGALYAALIFSIFLGTSNEPTQFIYFQF